MRDIAAFFAVGVFVFFALRNTYVAFLLWGWAGLMGLNFYLYGFMAGVPLAQTFALICLGRLMVDKELTRQGYPPNRTTILLGLFALHTTLSALFAYPDLPRNWEAWGNLMKTLLYCAVMPMVVRERRQIYGMVMMMVMGISFHGLLDGLKFLASGGAHMAAGIKFGDNNYYAVVLASVVPLALYLGRHMQMKSLRVAAFGVAGLTVLAVIATKSRGGLLCLMAIGLWSVMASSRKIAGLFSLIVITTLVISLAPASWFDRMNTMKEADQDHSFMGRVAAWRKSTAIAVDSPIFGGGLFAVQAPSLVAKFRDAPGLMGFVKEPDSGVLAAHSIYFQVLGDQGFVGLMLFVAVLLNAFMTRGAILGMLRRAKQRNNWAGDLADMLAASVLAFSLGGALLSAAYLEVPYLSFMLLEVLKLCVRRDLDANAKRLAAAQTV